MPILDSCTGLPLPWSQEPCAPGDIDVPICYAVPPSLVPVPGFKRITLLADCTASGSVILDSLLVPVPGAVEVGCGSDGGGCECTGVELCTALQGLPVQVPAPGDTALFVTGGGCFLGVPAGAGGFPGYGSPVTATGTTNAPGVSLLVARADHLHRVEVIVQEEGVLAGARPILNFIGAGVTAVDNPGSDRVDITIPGGGTPTFPVLAPNGTCAAPSYSFTASPDSGMFYDPAGAGAVIVGDDNCVDSVSIGASVAITTASTLRLTITNTGEWNIGGSVGAAGQVITSNGAGVPPTWQVSGGFPGYGSPVETACTNADGVSALVARADHVHRSEMRVQEEGTLVGERCAINFIGSGVTAVDNPGSDRVDVTIAISICDQIDDLGPLSPILLETILVGITTEEIESCGKLTIQDICDLCAGGVTFPLLAPDGSCAAPSYSFTNSPDSGMFYTGGSVRVGNDNCVDFIEIGVGVLIETTVNDITFESAAAINLDAGTSIGVVAATTIAFETASTARLIITATGEWDLAGDVGSAGEVLTSNGAGTPPTWQAGGGGSGPGSGAITIKVTGDSPYAVLGGDYTIVADTTAGDVTITLPAAPADGRILNCKKLFGTANDMVIDGNGKNIDGIATITTGSTLGPSFQIQFSTTLDEWAII